MRAKDAHRSAEGAKVGLFVAQRASDGKPTPRIAKDAVPVTERARRWHATALKEASSTRVVNSESERSSQRLFGGVSIGQALATAPTMSSTKRSSTFSGASLNRFATTRASLPT